MRWLISLSPFVFLLLWSGGFSVAKIGLQYADPLTLLSIRYGCVIIILLPFFFLYRPPLPINLIEWLNLIWVGFLIQVVYFGTAWLAFIKGGSAGTLALITSLQPILVALLMPLLSSERISGIRWIGLILGLSGTFLVLLGNSTLQPISVTVLLLALAALFAITLATVWEKRFGVAHHPLTANIIQYVIGFGCTLPLAILLEPMRVSITTEFAVALAYLVLGNSILAISLLLMMIRNGEATRVSALFFLVPPLAALIAWLLMDERMSRLAWLGLLVAAFGVWLATRSVALSPMKDK